MTGPELIFLHIPKAAGTSQHRSFRQYYGPENVFWIGEDCPGDVRRYPAKLVADRLLVGGHKPLSFYPSHFDPLFCAVLRDPVERAISLFSYYTQPGLARAEEGRIRRAAILERMIKNGMDPDSMLNSIRRCRSFRHEISNMQCRYVSESSANFAKAKDSLEQHDFVLGTIGTYDAFHRELGDLLDWPDEQPGALNRSKANYASAYLADEELVSLVRELNEEDEKLLHYVTQQHGGLYINFRDRGARVERLSGLPLKPWMSRPAQADWEATAGACWPARDQKRMDWPLEQVVVSEPARLLYAAIPGPANTVVQRLMLRTSAVKHQDALVGLGLGRTVARFRTGLMLSDLGGNKADAILQDESYFRFAILREPVDRLVRLYAQRFVVDRKRLAATPRLAALVRQVRGEQGSVEQGISFREFVSCILSYDPAEQHPLWAPQYRYLQALGDCDKLYRPDQLAILAKDLNQRCGVEAVIPDAALRVAPLPDIAGTGTKTVGAYADCLPAQLPVDASEWRDQLLDEQLGEMIMAYYDRDCDLYNRCAGNNTSE